MATLLIGYDLPKDGDYASLHAAIKALGPWWHHLDSTWLVKTSRTPPQVRDLLKRHLDSDDKLLVVDVSKRARAWRGFNARGSEWLHNTYD